VHRALRELRAEGLDNAGWQQLHKTTEDHQVGTPDLDLLKKRITPRIAILEVGQGGGESRNTKRFRVLEPIGIAVRADRDNAGGKFGIFGRFKQRTKVRPTTRDKDYQ
jgi:hypothetical protein